MKTRRSKTTWRDSLPTQREIRDYRRRDLEDFTNRIVRVVEDLIRNKRD